MLVTSIWRSDPWRGAGHRPTSSQRAARATEYEGFTQDLSAGIVVSGKEAPPRIQPLAPGAPGEGYGVLYECVQSVEPCTAPEESFVTPQNPFQALFTGPLEQITRNIRHAGL